MNIKIFLGLLLQVVAIIAYGDGMQQTLDSYLKGKRNLVYKKLEKSLVLRNNQDFAKFEVSLNFHKLNYLPLFQIFLSVHSFTLFNETYVLLDLDLYKIVLDEQNLRLDLHSRFPITSDIERISVVKTVEFNDIGVLFISFPNGNSFIYVFAKASNEWLYMQSIKNFGNAIDATLFVNNNFLYLVVVNSMGNALAPVIVYKWLGSHFDEIAGILLRGSISVASFSSENSEIIVVLQNVKQLPEIPSIVLELRSDVLTKLHYLDTQNPTKVILYDYMSIKYALVFDEFSSATLYRWDGFEFIQHSIVKTAAGVEKVLLVYEGENRIPVIFTSNLHIINAYIHSNENLRHFADVKLNRNIKHILDLHVIRVNNWNILTAFMLNENAVVDFAYFQYFIHINNEEKLIPKQNSLRSCINVLREQIIGRKKIVNEMFDISKELLQVNEPEHINGRLNVAFGVSVKNVNVSSKYLSHKYEKEVMNSTKVLDELMKNIDSLHSISKRSILTEPRVVIKDRNITKSVPKVLTIRGNIKVLGTLKTNLMKTKSIKLFNMNEFIWESNNWLSYSKPQIINSSVFTRSVNASNLNILRIEKSIFKGILLIEGNQKIKKFQTIYNLLANNLLTPSINNIKFDNIYLRSKKELVRGHKIIEGLNAKKLQVLNWNLKKSDSVMSAEMSENIQFSDNLKVRNLLVSKINGIDWRTFYRKTFKRGIDTVIKGNLFTLSTKVNNLITDTIGGVDAKKLFNTETDQIITSVIKFDNIHFENLKCKIVNQVDYKNEVANNVNNVIYGPVSFKNIIVYGDLFVNTTNYGDVMRASDNRVMGTKESDLLQIYNKRVVINGNLYLKNLKLLNRTTVVYKTSSGNKIFNKEDLNQYWSKDKIQVIPIKPNIRNGSSIEHLDVKFINNIPVDSIFINNKEDKMPTNIIFKNVTVKGNIYLSSKFEQDVPNLRNMQSQCIKLHNGSYIINGTKVFTGDLEVGELYVDILNDKYLKNIASSKLNTDIKGKKTFSKIIFNQPVTVTNYINVSNINGYDVERIKNNVVYIDRDANLGYVNMDRLKAKHITVTYLNNHEADEFGKFNQEQKLKKLIVNGDVFIEEIENLQTINQISDFNSFISRAVHSNRNHTFIKGNVHFVGNAYVENLNTPSYNSMDVDEILKTTLLKDRFQNITGKYVFPNLKTPYIRTLTINKAIPMDLIKRFVVYDEFDRGDHVLINHDLVLEQAEFYSIINDNFKCDMSLVERAMIYPPTRIWGSIHVFYDTHFLDDSSDIVYIMNNVVSNKQNSTISAPVSFKNRVNVGSVLGKILINDIDLMEIVDDAVLRSGREQYKITGSKKFVNMMAHSASVFSSISVNIVNGIDLFHLDKNLVRKVDIDNMKTPIFINGVKVFKNGAEFSNLKVDNLFGFNPNVFVNFNNLTTIPYTTFEHLEITESLETVFVNTLNFTQVLSNRLLIRCDQIQYARGYYYFDNVTFLGNLTAGVINNILVNDIVFDVGTQIIIAPKTFLSNVFREGDIFIKLLNQFDVNKIFHQSIMLNENLQTINHIIFQNTSVINGNFTPSKINSIPIATIESILNSTKHLTEVNYVNSLLHRLRSNLVNDGFFVEGLKSWEIYLYLEKVFENYIEPLLIPNSVSARANQFFDHLSLSIIFETESDICGLPKECSCFAQRDVVLSGENAINSLLKGSTTRSFSHEDKYFSIHVETQTFSTEPSCISKFSRNESTSVYWTTAKSKNSSKIMNLIKGYVRDVHFFVLNDASFLVVCPYYDSILNSYQLDCLVYRFSKNKHTVELIQKIPTNGAWITKTLNTMQGVLLIIGNYNKNSNTSVPENLNIFRYNATEAKFKLLTLVATSRCNSIAGIQIGEESFIVVAQTNGPLVTLKYDKYIDSYKLFQNINSPNGIIDVSIFNSGDRNHIQPFLCAATKSGEVLLYSYQNIQGWKLESKFEVSGVRMLVPYKINQTTYIFAVSKVQNELFIVVKQGKK